MNKIFKNKYDPTTGNTKAVSELGTNKLVASKSTSTSHSLLTSTLGTHSFFLSFFLSLATLSSTAFATSNSVVIKMDKSSKPTLEQGTKDDSVIIGDPNENVTKLFKLGTSYSTATKRSSDFDKVIVIGSKSVVADNGAMAIGYSSKAIDNGDIAIGYKAYARGGLEVQNPYKTGQYAGRSVALGYKAKVGSEPKNEFFYKADQDYFAYGSVAVGSEANIQSYGGIAIGDRAKVLRTSVGNGQYKARADNGIAIGREAIVEGDISVQERTYLQNNFQSGYGDNEHSGVAIGYQAKSKKFNSVALGSRSETTRETVLNFNEDTGENTNSDTRTFITSSLTALVNGHAKALGVVSVGKDNTHYRQIINVAPGTQATDAVNLAQLRGAYDDLNKKIEALPSGGNGGTAKAKEYDVIAKENETDIVVGPDTQDQNKTTFKLSLNKATEIKEGANNTDDDNKVVTSKAVETYVTNKVGSIKTTEVEKDGGSDALTITKDAQTKDHNKYKIKLDESVLITKLSEHANIADPDHKNGGRGDKKPSLVTDRQVHDALAEVKLSYKANSANGKTVKLSEGLNFTDTDNITASVDNNGVVKHTLKKQLININSINGKDGGSLTFDPAKDQSLSFSPKNGKQATVTGLTNKNWDSTKIESGRAATEDQLKAVEDKLIKNSISDDFAVKYDEKDEGGKKVPNKQKITLGENSKPVSLTNVRDGEIKATSKDAVNGGQLFNELAKKANKNLDNIDQDGKDVISKIAVGAITAEKEPSSSTALSVSAEPAADGKSKTIKVGLNESTLIQNLSNGANIATPNNSSPKLVTDKQVNDYVGNKKLIFADNASGKHESKLDSTFKLVGSDDITVAVSNDTNKQDGKATFTLNKTDTISDQNDTKNKVATAGAVKTYVDNALQKSKAEADETAVKYDNKDKNTITLGGKDSGKAPVAITNLESGLGLADDDITGNADTNKQKVAEAVKNLLKNTDKDALHTAVNAGDLKAIALSGLDFAGNSGEVHRNLGEKLNIKGAGDTNDFAGFEVAKGNINVKAENDTLTVELANKLKNLETAEFTSEEHRGNSQKQKVKATINGSGTSIKEIEDNGADKANGKTAEYNLDKTIIKDGNKETAITADGTKVIDGNKQVITTADGISIRNGENEDKEVLSIKNKDGKSEINFAKEKDAQGKEVGTGKIIGLADLADDADGSSAANKNYVDRKLKTALSDAAGNRPFDYYLDNVKVSKDKDGKFYKEGENGKKELTAEEKAKVVIKAEPTATSMVVTNIKDGKLSTDSKDAVNGSQLHHATGAMERDGKMTFADGRDRKPGSDTDAAANKGLTAQDGLNGKNANDKANALRNGEAGTLVYTDEAGNRLVKANDGEYYKTEDVDENGFAKVDKKSAVENPQLSLVNAEGKTDTSAVLSNAASGLGIETPTDEQKTKLGELAKAVDDKVVDVAKKAKTLSAQARAFSDLTLAVSSLEQVIDAMPEGEEKAQALATLKENKEELARVEAGLKTARDALQTVKTELTEANKAYDENYNNITKATDKIADLVKADSKAKVTNVATVGDLQAVAKAGLNFTGNDDVKVHKNIGENLSIKGEGKFNSETTAEGNIKVEISQDGQGLEVKLSDRLQNMTSFETREINGKKSALDANGLKVVGPNGETTVSQLGTHIIGKGDNAGKSASYMLDGVKMQDKDGNTAEFSAEKGLKLAGKTGEPSFAVDKNGLTLKGRNGDTIIMNGDRGEITLPDVKPDASGNVAVNKNYVDRRTDELTNRFNSANKEMRAGVAGSNAAASLPQVYMAGKSLVAVSAGAFKGESAFAVGYSRVSDSGKVLLKLQGNSNSAGDLGGGVGVGYLW